MIKSETKTKKKYYEDKKRRTKYFDSDGGLPKSQSSTKTKSYASCLQNAWFGFCVQYDSRCRNI